MSTDQTVEILHGILDCLKKQEVYKQQSREDHKFNKRRDSFAQICSMYAIIAIFIATLGVGFLTYMHDTFVDRPEEAPAKVTDHVATAFLFLSILLSISSSIALGAGASPTLLLSLPTKDSIQELVFLLVASGVPRPLAYRLRRFCHSIRESRKYTSQCKPVTPKSTTVNHARRMSRQWEKFRMTRSEPPTPQTPSCFGAGLFRRRWDVIRVSQHEHATHQTAPSNNTGRILWNKLRMKVTIGNFWASLRKVEKLPSTESQFVISMLLVALLCMALSLLSLAIAVNVFAWAELGKAVAAFITASLVFPFAVVGCVAMTYHCTLFRWNRKENGELVKEDIIAGQSHADNIV